MTDSELEAQVRSTLAAAFSVVEDGLPPWSPRQLRTRPNRRLALIGSIVATAAVVIALSVVVAVTRHGRGNVPAGLGTPSEIATSARSRPPSSVPTTLIGSVWVLTQISGKHGSVDLAADHPSAVTSGSHGASIHLSRSGAMVSSDTVNALNGNYALDNNTLFVEAGGSTAVGRIPHQHDWVDTVVEAIAAVSGGHNPVIVGGTSEQLTLQTDGYTLTFKNDGPAPDDPPLGQTPTPTAHGDYVTADDAVRATCQAVNILGVYDPAPVPPPAGLEVRVGWQDSGDAPGDGWAALVRGTGTGYRVIDCKRQAVVHG